MPLWHAIGKAVIHIPNFVFFASNGKQGETRCKYTKLQTIFVEDNSKSTLSRQIFTTNVLVRDS